MHILIVEDDRELCDALRLQLNARNHTADCCHTGSEALYCAMKGAYDLILLDRMLPEIDGLSILRSIRQNIWEIFWSFRLPLMRSQMPRRKGNGFFR